MTTYVIMRRKLHTSTIYRGTLLYTDKKLAQTHSYLLNRLFQNVGVHWVQRY